MTVSVSKSAFNVREALNALKKKTGLFGEQLLRTDTIDDFYATVGVNKNLIINGGFDVWQRSTSQTLAANAASIYVADRFCTNINSTDCTVSRQERTLGDTAIGAPVQYYSRWTMSNSVGSTAYVHIDHRIENVKRFDDVWVTLSFWARASAPTQIGFEFVSSYGGGNENNGSTYAPYNSKGFNVDTGWRKFTFTVKTINLTGKTIVDSTSNFICRFVPSTGSGYQPRWGGSLNFTGTFDMTAVQLEYGRAATPFEVKPLATETTLCQRYCYALKAVDSSPYAFVGNAIATSATYACISVELPVTMRVKPNALSLSSQSHFQITDYNAALAGSSIGLNSTNSTPKTAVIEGGITSGLTPGRTYVYRAANTLDAVLILSAEL